MLELEPKEGDLLAHVCAGSLLAADDLLEVDPAQRAVLPTQLPGDVGLKLI